MHHRRRHLRYGRAAEAYHCVETESQHQRWWNRGKVLQTVTVNVFYSESLSSWNFFTEASLGGGGYHYLDDIEWIIVGFFLQVNTLIWYLFRAANTLHTPERQIAQSRCLTPKYLLCVKTTYLIFLSNRTPARYVRWPSPGCWWLCPPSSS